MTTCSDGRQKRDQNCSNNFTCQHLYSIAPYPILSIHFLTPFCLARAITLDMFIRFLPRKKPVALEFRATGSYCYSLSSQYSDRGYPCPAESCDRFTTVLNLPNPAAICREVGQYLFQCQGRDETNAQRGELRINNIRHSHITYTVAIGDLPR